MTNLIIPVYKARDTLPRALMSAAAQTTNKFLITIVIDGDGIDYSDIVDQYRALGLHITVLTLNENHGAGYARQYAMDYDASRPANCDYYMFLDADDMLYPIAVEFLTSQIRAEGADIVIANFVRETDKHEFVEFHAENTAVTWMHGKIYSAMYLRRYNIRFHEDLRCNEDSYFNVVAVNSSAKVARVDVPVYLWRNNPNSITQSKENGSYFSRSNTDYIHGQLQGMKRIYELTGGIPEGTLAQTLLYIYYAMMQQEFEGLDDYSYETELYNFGTLPPVIDFFNKGDNWVKLVNSCKAGAVIDDTNIIFYKFPFSDWAQKYLIQEQKVNQL